MLGAVDLVVTDKTGTLTQNRLDVASVTDGSGGDPDARRARCALLLDALRAEDDAWEHGQRDPDELVHAGARARPSRPPAATRRSTRRTSSPRTRRPSDRPYADDDRAPAGHVETLILGAPEAVLGLATGSSASELAEWHARIEAADADGERVVALARQVDDGRLRDCGP